MVCFLGVWVTMMFFIPIMFLMFIRIYRVRKVFELYDAYLKTQKQILVHHG